MTDKQISNLLTRLNRGYSKNIVIAPITDNVHWGYVYDPVPKIGAPFGDFHYKGHEFFFVKAVDGKFAGAVHRFGPDEMHWFVAVRYRRRRLLVNPLVHTILPFIFARDTETKYQRGSLETTRRFAKQSASLAQRTGFKRLESNNGKDVYEIQRKDVKKNFRVPRKKPDESNIESLKREVCLSVRSMYKALATFEVMYGRLTTSDSLKLARNSLNSARIGVLDAMVDGRPLF